MQTNSSPFASQHQYPPLKTGSKLAAVEEKLKELFIKQQKGFGIPHKPIKVEKTSSRGKAAPVNNVQSSPPQRQQRVNEGQTQLTRKNMELFQQQHKEREKENLHQNQGDSIGDATQITQLDGSKKACHRDVHDIEVAKLRNTIATYEVNTNNLMKTLCSERESYRVATKDLQKTNEVLKNEVARIERSFREVIHKREDELRLNERFRHENDELLTKNLRLQHDLTQALSTIEKSEKLLEDMKDRMCTRQEEKELLAAQNKELSLQLERMRSTMSAWTANTVTGPDRSVGTTVTCALAKVIFVGSIIAVGLLWQVAQASPDDCDYVREALND